MTQWIRFDDPPPPCRHELVPVRSLTTRLRANSPLVAELLDPATGVTLRLTVAGLSPAGRRAVREFQQTGQMAVQGHVIVTEEVLPLGEGGPVLHRLTTNDGYRLVMAALEDDSTSALARWATQDRPTEPEPEPDREFTVEVDVPDHLRDQTRDDGIGIAVSWIVDPTVSDGVSQRSTTDKWSTGGSSPRLWILDGGTVSANGRTFGSGDVGARTFTVAFRSLLSGARVVTYSVSGMDPIYVNGTRR